MSFILPTAIVRIIDFVGLSDKNEIIFNSDNNNYALCKTLENEVILVRFLSNLKKIEITQEVLEDFFSKKAKNSFKPQSVLKLAKALGKDKERKKAMSSELKVQVKEEHPDMDDDDIMMEVVERLSSSMEQEAEKIILNDKTIRKNSVIRIPLSSGKEEVATFSKQDFKIYESFSLLMSKEREPRDSGMYLFSSNRHSIPLVLEKNKKGLYSMRFNGTFANKEILITLLNHGVRTFEKTGGYMLTIFLSKDKQGDEELNELVENLNKCSKSDSLKADYPETLKKIIAWIETNENEKILTFRNSFIYLPKQLEKDAIFHGTLFDDLSKALLNVSLRGLEYDDKDAIIGEIEKEKEKFFQDKKMYGFYNILYDIPEEESVTYGFLENNVQSHQIMSNFNDTLDLYKHLRDIYKDSFKTSSNGSEDSEPKNLEF